MARCFRAPMAKLNRQSSFAQVSASFFDTHCHIHFADYPLPAGQVLAEAKAAGVDRLLLVGCTLEDSQAAIALASKHDNLWATIGLHPHEAARYESDKTALASFSNLASEPKVVAIGETGLDFYYNHSPQDDQEKLLRFQLELAIEKQLPVIFHVRDAFDSFWPIFDDYPGLRGVIHSFTSTPEILDQVLSRGLYIGLNGIMTFTKSQAQLDAARQVPIDQLILETDAPFLTPVPFRGTICQPKHVVLTAEFLSQLRQISVDKLAEETTNNARKLFNL
jgi:TatD DNase family protein